MGANFKFDSMLPAINPETGEIGADQRQVEIFAHGGSMFLRVGALNQENTGVDCYTVRLDQDTAADVIHGIKGTMEYLGWRCPTEP